MKVAQGGSFEERAHAVLRAAGTGLEMGQYGAVAAALRGSLAGIKRDLGPSHALTLKCMVYLGKV